MAKRLYDLLVLCKDEEEVKSEFAKFFKIKLVTHKYKIDLYTNNTLFEFKHDRNFKSRTERAKVIAQTLYYVRKLKFGASTDPVPETICIVDKNEGFFVRTRDFHLFYNASAKYDWDRAASQPCPVLVESLKQSPLIADIHMYRFENPAEEDLFVNHVYAVAQQPLFQTDKKDINEDNFENVFYYWCTLFKKYVENGHKASEYFVSDIEEGRSKVIGDNEILFRLGDGTISKSVPMNEYNYFWNIYEKVQNPAIIKAIRQKIDRLSEDFSRRFTGEFYTPIDFAAKAFEYIKRTVGSEKYKQGNWRIWDMAAGTGNLEYLIESSVLDNCYISTLLEDDASYCKRIFPTATVFQYDYLNDDIFLIDNPNMVSQFIKPKMPKKLYDDLRNPDISWIIFINPPFATSNKSGKTTGKTSKDDVSMTDIQKIMTENGLGETSRELFAQFLYRISKEFAGKEAYLGLFSKIKYVNSNNDQKLRDDFFTYKFERGFIFSSETFVGTKGKFPVGFLVWNLSKNQHIENQDIVLDVYNADCEKIGTKPIPTMERSAFLSKWVERYRNSYILPPITGGITLSTSTKDVRDRVAEGFLCSLQCKGNDFQNQNYVTITSGPNPSAGAFSVIPENFEKSMVLHAVRRIPKHTWDKDRDQFYQPLNDDLPTEFVNDCVIWSAFAPSNGTVAMKDVVYKGNTYQIHNEMYPFLLSEVSSWKCGLTEITRQVFSANEDRFLAKWINAHEISDDAKELLLKAKALYQCVYANLGNIRWLDYKIELWDIGWYQIKEAAKAIPDAVPLLEDVRKCNRELANKILPQISQYGFLPPDIQYFEE
ncbi:MAG: hypothetical protein E7504_04550 [Ruminococcus sp.]|nr:hypothetical protein [Ruminococcus sp.]